MASSFLEKMSHLRATRESLNVERHPISDIAKGLDNPDNLSLYVFDDAYRLHQRLISGEFNPKIQAKYESALNVLTDVFRLYSPECVYGSYNGGKDAVVIMHLMRAALAKYSASCGRLYQPRLIYFTHPKEFPEVEDLVMKTASDYELSMSVYDCGFLAGLTECVEKHKPQNLAFVLGTRRGDPNCGEQQHFTPSSDWMPPFMRVNPIIDWTYGQIWEFLCDLELPYCSLYDEGYTSLGKMDDTVRNPALRKLPGEGYWPAYTLTDWSLERAGRNGRDNVAEPNQDALQCEFNSLDKRVARICNATTAGLVIIGDEILTSKTKDSNSACAIRSLRAVGVTLKRIAVIGDNFDEIRDEVRRQSSLYDLVITSGGVGPTHDDVTVKSVAAALNMGMALNPSMLQTIVKKLGVASAAQLEASQRKMAELPDMARLRFPPASSDKEDWPILQCENVFVLPGVPDFFECKFKTICDHFLHGQTIYTAKIALAIEESSFADSLNKIVEAFDSVAFGSYPYYADADKATEFLTIITVESLVESEIDAAVTALLEKVHNDDLVLKVTRGVTCPDASVDEPRGIVN